MLLQLYGNNRFSCGPPKISDFIRNKLNYVIIYKIKNYNFLIIPINLYNIYEIDNKKTFIIINPT